MTVRLAARFTTGRPKARASIGCMYDDCPGQSNSHDGGLGTGSGTHRHGATQSILSKRIYDKIVSKGTQKSKQPAVLRHTEFFAADASPMPVITDFDVDIRIGGVRIPMTLAVIEKLGYDLILGMDFFKETDAVVDVKAQLLSLYNGLTMVPMTSTGDSPVATSVNTVTIPPYSEAIFPISTTADLPNGDFIFEPQPASQSAKLLIASALVDARRKTFPCRVLNPSEKPITLRAGTPLGI